MYVQKERFKIASEKEKEKMYGQRMYNLAVQKKRFLTKN